MQEQQQTIASQGPDERRQGAQTPLLSETYVPLTMPAVLGKFDMTVSAILALFLLTSIVPGAGIGPVSLVYLGLGAVVFLAPCVISVIQLGALLPNEGSLYNWTTRALNPFVGFFIGGVCSWLTGVVAVVIAGGAFVTTVQWLHPTWLAQPWQQGVTILALIALAAGIGLQRMRTIQTFMNLVFFLLLAAVLLVGLAAIVWLLTRHHSATNFTDRAGWTPTPATYFLFAILTVQYIGASGPLNLAGEIRGRGSSALVSTIRQHLLIGAPVVVLLSTIVTTSTLVVGGSSGGMFSGLSVVQQVLGTITADIAVIFYLAYLIAAMLFYTYASARLMMVAGIDQFLTVRFAHLNKHRAPGAAIIVHALAAAIVVVLVYIIAPAVVTVGENAASTTSVVYTEVTAACALIWILATTFFFVDLVVLYRRDRRSFRAHRQFPMWVIWGSVVVGGVACLVTLAALLVYPWIPGIGHGQWLLVVGGLTIGVLFFASILSVGAGDQAAFEQMT